MSNVNEALVCEFFESLGYQVSRPCKYIVPGRQKTAFEEIDLIVSHPRVADMKLPEHVLWGADDLANIPRAVVAVRGWHTERFSAKILEKDPEILRFAQEPTVKAAEERLGPGPVAKILCLAQLPASQDLKQSALDLLRSRGVDGVLLFRTILQHLIRETVRNRNYERSDVLQMIRIFKVYGLLKGEQMELFERHGRRRATQAVA